MIPFLRAIYALTLGRQQQRALGILQLLEMDELTVTELYVATRFRKRELYKILSQLCAGKMVASSTVSLLADPPIPIVRYRLTSKGKEFLEKRRK